MRRWFPTAIAVLLAATAARARAQPAAATTPVPTRPSAAVFVTAALGGGAHDGARSVSLGLGTALLLRDGALVLGGTGGGDLFLHGYTTGHLAMLAGVTRDLHPHVRVDLLGELGTRHIAGIGNEPFEVRAVSPDTVRLTYAGARLGMLLAVGDGVRLVWGAWIVYREDLFRKTVDVVVEDVFTGSRETHRLTVGGRDLSLVSRVGVEF